MGRLSFESLQIDAEPDAMSRYYSLISDADSIQHLNELRVSPQLQTLAYAKAVLARYTLDPNLTVVRAETRIGREQILHEARIPSTAVMGQRALLQDGLFTSDVMAAQIEQILLAVEKDIRRGSESTLHVGILPNADTTPIDDVLLLERPTFDGITIQTPEGLHAVTMDGTTIDTLGNIPNSREREVADRLAAIGTHMAQAAFGEEALIILRGILQKY